MENSSPTNQLVETVLNHVRTIFLATDKLVHADKNRKPMGEVSKQVSEMLSMDLKKVTPLVGFYLHNMEPLGIGYVNMGANGGYIPGIRPSKPEVKANAVINASVTVTTTPATETTESSSTTEEVPVAV